MWAERLDLVVKCLWNSGSVVKKVGHPPKAKPVQLQMFPKDQADY